jgi:hypothetical protein
MFDKRTNLANQVWKRRKDLKDMIFNTRIPRTVRLSAAPSHGKPILCMIRPSRAEAICAGKGPKRRQETEQVIVAEVLKTGAGMGNPKTPSTESSKTKPKTDSERARRLVPEIELVRKASGSFFE